MRLSEFQEPRFKLLGEASLPEFVFADTPMKAKNFLEEETGITFQVCEQVRSYRYAEPYKPDEEAPFGNWLPLDP
jgi:hypothetical protein